MTDTIRLSDRLELRRKGTNGSTRFDSVHVDGTFNAYVTGNLAEALIEACAPSSDPNRFTAEVDDDCQLHFLDGGRRLGTLIPDATVLALAAQINTPPAPSRLILPPGVEQGYVLKAGNPLPDEWEVFYENGWLDPGPHARSADAWSNHDVLCRPTAANPLPTLPATCWQIPDGRICCLRKDAQALRDQGATIHWTDNGSESVREGPVGYPSRIMEVRFPEPPKTERVPWWEAKGRTSPNGYEITDVEWRKHQDHPFFYAKQGWKHADADGTVEVLVEAAAETVPHDEPEPAEIEAGELGPDPELPIDVELS